RLSTPAAGPTVAPQDGAGIAPRVRERAGDRADSDPTRADDASATSTTPFAVVLAALGLGALLVWLVVSRRRAHDDRRRVDAARNAAGEPRPGRSGHDR
ncbi:MAG: hypothetical protein ACRCZP_05560, partial [Phycicoccus sp.]